MNGEKVIVNDVAWDLDVIGAEIVAQLFAALRHVVKEETPKPYYCCARCGDQDIQAVDWVYFNGGEATGDYIDPELWCPTCELHDFEVCLVEPDGRCANHDQPHEDCRAENRPDCIGCDGRGGFGDPTRKTSEIDWQDCGRCGGTGREP